MKCNHDLAECECPDLKERLEIIAKSPHVHIGDDYKARLAKRAEQNKNEQTREE